MKIALFATTATLFLPAYFALPKAPSSSGDAAPVQAVVTRVMAEEDHHADVRDIVGRAKISLRDAIARALAAQPGRAVEADLEGEIDDEQLDVFFEVLVLDADNELVEVRLDPQTGEVRSREEAEDDEDEVPGFQAALRHGEHDLQKLVEMAEMYVKGTAVSASLEFEDGMPRCGVAFVHTRYVIDVEVEALAGHLVEIELRGEAADDEHGEEGEEGEHGEESEMGEKGERGEEEREPGEHREGKGREEEEAEAEEAAKPAKQPGHAGAGLGLPLVAAIARAHGGSCALEHGEPGLTVVVRLPGCAAR